MSLILRVHIEVYAIAVVALLALLGLVVWRHRGPARGRQARTDAETPLGGSGIERLWAAHKGAIAIAMLVLAVAALAVNSYGKFWATSPAPASSPPPPLSPPPLAPRGQGAAAPVPNPPHRDPPGSPLKLGAMPAPPALAPRRSNQPGRNARVNPLPGP